jgi:hypothetical protein
VAAHAALGVGQQRFGDQLGAEERATDADVDHVGDRLFGVAAPQAVVDAADQFGDLVQHLVHFRHDVHAVDAELVADRAAQGGVQHRAAFGGVDDFAANIDLMASCRPTSLARFTSRSRVCSVIRFFE